MPAYQNLYFIAIIPPQPICNDITSFKQDIAQRFNSRHALKTVPHITLKAPFKLLSTYDAALKDWFQNASFPVISFQQMLDGFGAFGNKKNPVIFVKPEASASLIKLQKELIQSFQNTFSFLSPTCSDKDFHPHITIAYRDLSLAHFGEAWREYGRKEYKASFTVNGLFLLQHDGTAWQPVAACALSYSF